MRKRNLDNIRGSWLALVVLLCLGGIFFLGLGSERVRRVVRDALPAVLGGSTSRTGTFWDEQAAKNPPPAEKKKEEDPDALPVVPKEDSFQGIVKDSAGAPLAGAVVTAERWRESKWEVLASGRTNKNGEFV